MSDAGFSRRMGRKIRASNYAKKKRAQESQELPLKNSKQFPEPTPPKLTQEPLFDMPAPRYDLNH